MDEAGAVPVAMTSERVRLARVALAAALGLPEVAGATAGPLGANMTATATERLEGVLAAVQADGRYGLTLWLIARPAPLLALAERVRERVRDAASEAGMLDRLGSIDVRWADLVLDPPGLS